MTILDVVITIFIVMESMNICILYFAPNSKLGNGIGVFKAWEKSQNDENIKLFATYLKNWVAGVKLIFVVLLVVILFNGSQELKLYSIFVLILSISSYYIGLHPIIKKLDKMGEIEPRGYSKALLGMITGFLIMFLSAIFIYCV